jgi:hypothetical protein
LIPFQNHFLGKPVNFGGENYKMLRLFKKNKVIITAEKTHQKYLLKSKKVGYLRGKIIHYSYQSLWQTYKKFTYYGLEEAKKKLGKNEKITLKKLFLYPPHMFYARFIKDRGYKDGYRARIRNHGHSCFLCEIVIRSQFHTTYEPEA